MSIQFSHADGKPIGLTNGFPDTYNGAVLKNARASYSKASFGEIVLQEHNDEYVSVRKVTIHWRKPERIVCHYDHAPGIFSRITFNRSVHEYIKGAGDIYLKPEQFSIIAGSSWIGLLSAVKPGEHNFIDISWSAGFLKDLLSNEQALNDAMQNAVDGYPQKIIGPPTDSGVGMRQVLDDVQHINFTMPGARGYFHERMEKYYTLMVKETTQYTPGKKGMNESEWNGVHNAKQLIDDNLDKQYSTPEISRIIGMNEYKLKKLFPRITGYSIDEYRRYRRCTRVVKKVVEMSEIPIKHFYAEAGYSDVPSLTKGFVKLCYCTPGELRRNSWDLSGLPHI